MKFKEIFDNKKFIIHEQTDIDQAKYEERQSLHIYDLLTADDGDDHKSIVQTLLDQKLASLCD